MKQKALFITTQFPYPAFSGGKLISLEHLRLIANEYQTDVVCKASIYPNKKLIHDFKQKYQIHELHIFEHWIKTNEHLGKAIFTIVKALWKFEPYKILKHFNKQTENKIGQLLEQSHYALVVFDQLPSMQPETLKKSKYANVLFAHNSEFETVATQIKSQRSQLTKLFLCWEANRLKRHEHKMYELTENVIFLSPHDKNKFSEVSNPFILSSYANLFEATKHKMAFNSILKKRFFLVASWSWSPNREGLLWFVDNVVPMLNNNIEIIIAGDGMNEKLKNRLQHKKAIQLVGKVDEVDSYYANSHIAIIPLFGGSGIKIKVVDAMAHGIPIITTSFGIQGLEDFSDGVCVADDAIHFANHIHSILKNEDLYKIYQKRIEKSYVRLQNQKIEKPLYNYLYEIEKIKKKESGID